MASESGGESGFNFELEPSVYSDQAVAVGVVWPLVRHLAVNQKKADGNEAVFAEFDSYAGDRYDVRLSVMADDEGVFGDAGEPYALMCVEKLPRSEEEAVFILEGAKRAVIATYGKLDATDKHGLEVWPKGEEDEFEVGLEQTFLFGRTGLRGVRYDRKVSYLNRAVDAPFDDADASQSDSNAGPSLSDLDIPKLSIGHLDSIEAACHLFKAPNPIKTALATIKEDPYYDLDLDAAPAAG